MKTIILLASESVHWIKFYNFATIPEIKSCRLIAIVGKKNYINFPDFQKKHFQHIYQVPYLFIDEVLWPLDPKAVSEVVRKELQHNSAAHTYIISVDEGNVELSGQLREVFHLPGNRAAALLPYRDKVLMKQKLQAKGVRTPHFQIFNASLWLNDAAIYFKKLQAEVGFPFILKPKNSAGSVGVELIETFASFVNFTARKEFFPHDYEVEEYIQGTLYSVNSIIKNDEVLFSEPEEYTDPMLNLTHGKNVIGSIALVAPEQRPKLIAFAEQSLRVLGMVDGVKHMEIFINKHSELIFLEVASRMPGAFIIRNYMDEFNINLANLDLQVQADLPLMIDIKHNIYSFFAIFPKKAGEVIKLNEPNLESGFKIVWNVKKGDILESPKSLMDNCGLLFVENKNREILLEDIAVVQRFKPIETM